MSFPLLTTAQTAEEKGLEIVSKAIDADRGFGSSSVDLRMVLKNKNGQLRYLDIDIKCGVSFVINIPSYQ